MKRVAMAFVLAALSAAMICSAENTIPKPALVSTSWELDFKAELPQALRVKVPGEAKLQTFWYMRYTVSNRTNRDQMFVPEFVLYTDSGQVLRAGQRIPPVVYESIKKLYNDPHMVDTISITGKILQGDDNARTGVAIWPDFDAKASNFDVFVGGLSGESTELKLPTPIEVSRTDINGETKKVTKTSVVLVRTLAQHYKVTGEAASRESANIQLADQEWVMR